MKKKTKEEILQRSIYKATEHILQIESLLIYILISIVILTLLDNIDVPGSARTIRLVVPSLLLVGLGGVLRVTNPQSGIRDRLKWAAILGGATGAIVGAFADILAGGATGGQGTLYGWGVGTTAGAALGEWIESWGSDLVDRAAAFDYLFENRTKNPKLANSKLINLALDQKISIYDRVGDGSNWYSTKELREFV